MIQTPIRSTPSPRSSARPQARPDRDRVAQRSAAARLECHPHFRGRQRFVRCYVQDGVLTLVGCVPSYFLKALAQEALRDLPGVHTLRNRICVAGRAPGLGSPFCPESEENA